MKSAMAAGWLLGLPLAGLVALGSAWLLDRSRPWESACWRPDRFVLLAGRCDPDYRGERWVVAVQPNCSHCLAMTPLIADSARRLGVRVAALLVDCPRAPDPASLRSLRVDELWWDAGDIWHGRWGHRIYGELMRFDSNGRLIESPFESRFESQLASQFDSVGAPERHAARAATKGGDDE